jgi:hypothetical protein
MHAAAAVSAVKDLRRGCAGTAWRRRGQRWILSNRALRRFARCDRTPPAPGAVTSKGVRDQLSGWPKSQCLLETDYDTVRVNQPAGSDRYKITSPPLLADMGPSRPSRNARACRRGSTRPNRPARPIGLSTAADHPALAASTSVGKLGQSTPASGHSDRPPNAQLCTSTSAYRSAVHRRVRVASRRAPRQQPGDDHRALRTHLSSPKQSGPTTGCHPPRPTIRQRNGARPDMERPGPCWPGPPTRVSPACRALNYLPM